MERFKYVLKKTTAILMIAVLLIGIAPIGSLTDVDWFEFALTASAATEGYYTYEISNNVVTITDVNTSISGSITIPSKLGGYVVTKIGSSAFKGCKLLQRVTIPDSVDSIGSSAFEDCIGLTYARLPNSITKVPSRLFYNCYNLGSVAIPEKVTSIGASAFYNCDFTNIKIPDSVVVIDSYAFAYNGNLTGIEIPDGIEVIAAECFTQCYSLDTKGIVLPNSIKTIYRSAFTHVGDSLTTYYRGMREQWNNIHMIDDRRYDVFNERLPVPEFEVHYNANTSYFMNTISAKSSVDEVVVSPKEVDEVTSLSVIDFSKTYFSIISDVTIKSSLGEETISGSFKAKKADVENDDIVLSKANYQDYIIPSEVIKTWYSDDGAPHELDAILLKDRKDGKPYVSTVFGKSSREGREYKEIMTSTLGVNDIDSYDIIISAGNVSDSATYYITQDSETPIKSDTGIFHHWI